MDSKSSAAKIILSVEKKQFSKKNNQWTVNPWTVNPVNQKKLRRF